jgi:hypothetical protein
MCHRLHYILMWCVPQATVYIDVICATSCSIYWCDMCHGLQYILMWCVSQATVYIDVICATGYCIYWCDMCHRLQYILMWYVSQAAVYIDVMCVTGYSIYWCDVCHRLQYIYYQTGLRVICGKLSKRSRATVLEYCVNTSYRAVMSCVVLCCVVLCCVVLCWSVRFHLRFGRTLTSLSRYWTSSSSMAGDVMASRRKQKDSKMADSCVIAATEWQWH